MRRNKISFNYLRRLPTPPSELRYRRLNQPDGRQVDVDYEITQGDDLFYYCEDTEAVLSDGTRRNFFLTT